MLFGKGHDASEHRNEGFIGLMNKLDRRDQIPNPYIQTEDSFLLCPTFKYYFCVFNILKHNDHIKL